MMEVVHAIKNILTNNAEINHIFVGDYEDFIPEKYPAVCIQPIQDSSVLEESLGFIYDEVPRLSVFYVSKAPEDRDKTTFIQKMDMLKGILENNPTLNNTINSGANFTFAYGRRTIEDNIEFITQITIEGRKINGNR